jgi:hypothetical protein
MAIIGLCGFINSGKGTVADLLVQQHGYIKESFANSVKDSVSVIFGWDREMLEGATPESRQWRETKDEWWSQKLGREISPRMALQLMGTEAGRDVFHSDLWIHTVERRCSSDKNCVIADVRFPNEIENIHRMGGVIIRVRRGDEPEWYETALTQNTTKEIDQWMIEDKKELMQQKYPNIHYSEWAWVGSYVDHVIENDDTFESLQKKVDFLIKYVYN